MWFFYVLSIARLRADGGHRPKADSQPTLRPTARVGWNNLSQAVTMPLEFRSPDSVREVFIRREGESVVLTPRATDWSSIFASGLTASSDFLAEAECMPIQERTF